MALITLKAYIKATMHMMTHIRYNTSKYDNAGEAYHLILSNLKTEQKQS